MSWLFCCLLNFIRLFSESPHIPQENTIVASKPVLFRTAHCLPEKTQENDFLPIITLSVKSKLLQVIYTKCLVTWCWSIWQTSQRQHLLNRPTADFCYAVHQRSKCGIVVAGQWRGIPGCWCSTHWLEMCLWFHLEPYRASNVPAVHIM